MIPFYFSQFFDQLPLLGHLRRRRRLRALGIAFIRRFLIQVLPRGFHRIRHYGLLSSFARKDSLALARRLLGFATPIADLRGWTG